MIEKHDNGSQIRGTPETKTWGFSAASYLERGVRRKHCEVETSSGDVQERRLSSRKARFEKTE